jgi:hypothetical protein
MAVRKFSYPLKGNNDQASLRTKEIALEAFLNSLSLSDDPDDPSHNHDPSYAPIAHSHSVPVHTHAYITASEGSSAPGTPDIGDIWIENNGGNIDDVWVWTGGQGWVSILGGGGGGGPHDRHPDNLLIYQSSDNEDKWDIQWNAALTSLDFVFVG